MILVAKIKGRLLAAASCNKASHVRVKGSGTFPSGKVWLVSSRRRLRRSFANGSTLAGFGGLGMNLEIVVNWRPAVCLGGRRATEASYSVVNREQA